MARIRTIKPEFPQSESMGRISRDARLMFIMLWTLADDEGRLRGNSRMLASLLFPYDDDARELSDGWLCELEAEGCIVRYKSGENSADSYVQICNWLIHQKIDKPSKSKLPAFENPRESSRILPVGSKDLDLRIRGEEGTGNVASDGGNDQPKNPPQPQQENFTGQVMTDLTNQVVDLYEKTFGLGLVRGTQTLMTIGQRAMQYPKAQNPEWWGAFFDEVSADDFLSGRKPKTDGKPFELTLNYLLKEEVFQSIIERSQRRSMAHA